MSETDGEPLPDPGRATLGKIPTAWMRVREAQETGERGRAALRDLAERYYPAVCATLLRRGLPADQAGELAQQFAVRMLEGHYVREADRARGSFRAFLKTCLINFVRDQSRAARRREVSLETMQARGDGPATPDPLDGEIERHWAAALWVEAGRRLRRELEDTGRRPAWTAFERMHNGDGPPPAYDALAAELGIPVTTLNNHLHRTRERFRQIVLEVLHGETSSDEEALAELGHFARALGARSGMPASTPRP